MNTQTHRILMFNLWMDAFIWDDKKSMQLFELVEIMVLGIIPALKILER